jgi:hypothetical protein
MTRRRRRDGEILLLGKVGRRGVRDISRFATRDEPWLKIVCNARAIFSMRA